jgi:hypothetical protein
VEAASYLADALYRCGRDVIQGHALRVLVVGGSNSDLIAVDNDSTIHSCTGAYRVRAVHGS